MKNTKAPDGAKKILTEQTKVKFTKSKVNQKKSKSTQNEINQNQN